MAWYNPFSWGASAEQARADSLDAQLRALNERDYGPGGSIYTEIQNERGTVAADATYQTVEQHLSDQEAASRDIAGQIDTAFAEGAAEGAANIRHTFDSAVFGSLGGVLKAVPVSVWIAAILVSFFYFGGWAWLLRRVSKLR